MMMMMSSINSGYLVAAEFAGSVELLPGGYIR